MFGTHNGSKTRRPIGGARWRTSQSVKPRLITLEDRSLLSFSAIAPVNYPYYNNPAEFGSTPQAVAVGDLRGNGLNDIVTTQIALAGSDPTLSVVNVYLNNGDGTFQALVHYLAGPGPRAIALGDFNNDGKLDIVVTNAANGAVGHTVSVLLGNGDGTFQDPLSYLVGRDPAAVAVGHFAGDGNLDIVTGNGDGTVSVLLGNGDGTFKPTVDYDVGSFFGSVAVGDLRGNGTSDIVVSSNDTVSVLLGNGDGTFQRVVHYSPGNISEGIRSLALGDFNGDGKLDIVTANGFLTHSFSILLGNGDGTFQTGVTHATNLEVGGVRVATADFRGTGRSDVVLLNSGLLRQDQTRVPDTISVFLNSGSGTFQEPVTIAAGALPLSVAVADLRGDGKLDLAVVNNAGGDVSVIFGNGDGTFQVAPTYDTGRLPVALATGDLRNDGVLDLVTANQLGNTVSVLLGNGDGTFRPAINFPAGNRPLKVVVGDFNGDGIPDLLVLDTGVQPQQLLTLSWFQGNGDGTFQPAQTLTFAPVPNGHVFPNDLVVGDFRGDGKLDVAVSAVVTTGGRDFDEIDVLPGNGDGSFNAPVRAVLPIGANPGGLAVGDFNGDGQLDLAATGRNGTRDGVYVLQGNGDGTFGNSQFIQTGTTSRGVAVGDFRGNGLHDLAVTNSLSATVSVLLSNGDGTFQDPVNYLVGGGPVSVVVGDITGDGIPALVIANAGGNAVDVLAGNGDGSFQSPVRYLVGTGAFGVVTGDFNRDGLGDIATSVAAMNSVAVLLNTSATAGAPQTAGAPAVPGLAKAAGAALANLHEEALLSGKTLAAGAHGPTQPTSVHPARPAAQASDLAIRDALFGTRSTDAPGLFERPRSEMPADTWWADDDRWDTLLFDQAFSL